MSNVHLRHRPRRVPCDGVRQPPPFRSAVLQASGASAAASRASTRRAPAMVVIGLPVRLVMFAVEIVGWLLDMTFALLGITLMAGAHLVIWSYAFGIGPAASCMGLPCPAGLQQWMPIALGALAATTYVVSRLVRRAGGRATSIVMLVVVTFDLAAIIVLLVS